MKHIFIINPTSGNGKYKDIIIQINQVFENRDDFEIIMTEYPGHAQEIAQSYRGDFTLYSVGGDGTAHEVLNGLQEGVAMGLVPVGSGNDFRRNIEPLTDLENIVSRLVNGAKVDVDYVMFNDRKQLNCANIGLDADVNEGVNQSNIKFLPRKFLYALFALKCLIFKKTINVDVEVNGKRSSHNVLLASFMNGSYYGGGFKSAPLADVTDGLMDVTLIRNISRLRILSLMPVYFKGQHMGLDIVEAYQTDHIKVTSKIPIIVGCDGEIMKMNAFELKVIKHGLPLVLPQGSVLKGQSNIVN